MTKPETVGKFLRVMFLGWSIMCLMWYRISSSPQSLPLAVSSSMRFSREMHWWEKPTSSTGTPAGALSAVTGASEDCPGSFGKGSSPSSPVPQTQGRWTTEDDSTKRKYTALNLWCTMSASSALEGSIEWKTDWCRKDMASAPHLSDEKNNLWCRKMETLWNPRHWLRTSMTWLTFSCECIGASHVEKCNTSPTGCNTTGIQWPSSIQAVRTSTPCARMSGCDLAQAWHQLVPWFAHPVSKRGSNITNLRPAFMWPAKLPFWKIRRISSMWWQNSSSDHTPAWLWRITARSVALSIWLRSASRCLLTTTDGGFKFRNCTSLRPSRGAAEIHDSWATALAWKTTFSVMSVGTGAGSSCSAWTGHVQTAVGLMQQATLLSPSQVTARSHPASIGSGGVRTSSRVTSWQTCGTRSLGRGHELAKPTDTADSSGADRHAEDGCSGTVHRMQITWPGCKTCVMDNSSPFWSLAETSKHSPVSCTWACMNCWIVVPSVGINRMGSWSSCWKTTVQKSSHGEYSWIFSSGTCQGVGVSSHEGSANTIMGTSGETSSAIGSQTPAGTADWDLRIKASRTEAMVKGCERSSGHRCGCINSWSDKWETCCQNPIKELKLESPK